MLLGKLRGMKSDVGIIGALAILMLIFSLSSKYFLEAENIFNTLRAFSFTGISALGQLVVVITGCLDLTSGSVMALASINTALCLKAGIPIPLSILAGLLTGTTVGVINSFLITKTKLNPVIATLAMMSVVRGLTFILTKAETVYGLPENYLKIGAGYMFKIVPIPVVVYFVIAILLYLFLTKTVWGYEIYAVGGNDVAA